jgi:hypothetical protein
MLRLSSKHVTNGTVILQESGMILAVVKQRTGNLLVTPMYVKIFFKTGKE